MPQNWEEKLNSEFNWNEVFGKNSSAQKAIVAFIKQISQQAIDKTREEMLKEILTELRLKLRNTYKAEDIADTAFLTESDLESVLDL